MDALPCAMVATGHGLQVPADAAQFILIQRPYLIDAVGQAYAADVRRDYEELRPWLPPSAEHVLDIGAGMAGIDVLLYRHYGQVMLHLLDGTGVGKIKGGYAAAMQVYNSRSVAERFLAANGIPASHIRHWEPYQNHVIECDLLISLSSWGLHYPIAAYLETARRSLRPGGRLILDIRRQTDGEAELAAYFEPLAVLRDEAKFRRLVLAAGESAVR